MVEIVPLWEDTSLGLPCEHTARRWPSASQEESPCKNSATMAPWPQISSLQSYEIINCSQPVYGNLLCQPELINTVALVGYWYLAWIPFTTLVYPCLQLLYWAQKIALGGWKTPSVPPYRLQSRKYEVQPLDLKEGSNFLVLFMLLSPLPWDRAEAKRKAATTSFFPTLSCFLHSLSPEGTPWYTIWPKSCLRLCFQFKTAPLPSGRVLNNPDDCEDSDND